MRHQYLDDDEQGIDVGVSRNAPMTLAANGATQAPDFHNVCLFRNGLRTAEFDGGNTSAGCRSPDGLLWFPSVRRIVRVDPPISDTNPLPPPVDIEQVCRR